MNKPDKAAMIKIKLPPNDSKYAYKPSKEILDEWSRQIDESILKRITDNADAFLKAINDQYDSHGRKKKNMTRGGSKKI